MSLLLPYGRRRAQQLILNGSAPLDYEAARDELTEVVRKLEAGGLSLEESLALWERGEQLAVTCERHLAGARERIESVIAVRELRDAEPPPVV